MTTANDNDLGAMRKASTDRTSGDRCVVGKSFDALTSEQQATFNEAMWGAASHDITAAAIAEFARDQWGWSMAVSTLRVHRRKGCSCDFS